MSASDILDTNPQYHHLITPYFNTLAQNNEAVLSLWFLKADYKPELEKFIKNEQGSSGQFDYHMVVINTPFVDSTGYGNKLIKALKPQSQASGSDAFTTIDFGENNGTTSLLVKELIAIQSKLPASHNKLLLWLIPNNIADVHEVEKWLERLLNQEIPENIKFAFTLEPEQSNFANLIGQFGSKVFLLFPDNNAAYNNVVENPEDPYVQFRTYFLKFGEAVSAGDYGHALELGEKAIELSKQQKDWEQMEVGMLIAMAELLIEDDSQKAKAMSYFDQADAAARMACENEHPSGKVLLLQTINAKGSAHLYLGDYNQAIKLFQESITAAEQDDYCFYYLMEAQRLTALCYEQISEFSKAWTFNEDALKTAGSLDQQIRMRTTVPSIGESLFRLSSTLKKQNETHRINQKLIELVGENWHELI